MCYVIYNGSCCAPGDSCTCSPQNRCGCIQGGSQSGDTSGLGGAGGLGGANAGAGAGGGGGFGGGGGAGGGFGGGGAGGGFGGGGAGGGFGGGGAGGGFGGGFGNGGGGGAGAGGGGGGGGFGSLPGNPPQPTLGRWLPIGTGGYGLGTTSQTFKGLALNQVTTTECIKVPLKSGGKMPLSLNVFLVDYQQVNGGYQPGGSGGVFNFDPYLQSVAPGYSPAAIENAFWGKTTYQTSGAANSESTKIGIFGTTYFTTYDNRQCIYYEYWNAGSYQFNRQYDAYGNQLITNRNVIASPTQALKITGDVGLVIPYFGYTNYYGAPTNSRLNTILLADLANSANNRVAYFEYTDDSYLSAVIYPNGCKTLYNYWNNVSTASFAPLISVTDAEGYVTYFEWVLGIGNGTPQVRKVIEPEGKITYFNYPASWDTRVTQLGRGTTYYLYAIDSGSDQVITLTNKTDPLGNATYFGYDPTLNRVTQRQDPNGYVQYFQYTGGAALNKYAIVKWSYVAPAGSGGAGALPMSQFSYKQGAPSTYKPTTLVGARNTFTYPVYTYYLYDGSQGLVGIVDPLANSTLYKRDSLGRVTAVQDPRNNVTYYNYGTVTGHLDSEVAADGVVAYYGYNSFRDMLQSVSPRWPENGFAAFTTYYAYDQLSRPVRTTDPLGNVTYYDWTPRSDLLDMVDARGTETAYTYNGLRLLTEQVVTDSSGNQLALEKYGYDIYKNRIRTQDALGYSTYFFYDQLDRGTAFRDALGNSSYFGYDSMGNPIAISDRRGMWTYYVYDTLSRTTARTDSLGNSSSYFYDLASNLSVQQDERGSSTYYFYDQLDRLNVTRDALANPTYFFFDPAGNRSVEVDSRFNATYHYYDSRNRAICTLDAQGSLSYYFYDGGGNQTCAVNKRGVATYYAYDALDRLNIIRDGLGNCVYFFFDAVGNSTVQRDARGNVTYFVYDGLNRLVQMVNPLGDQQLVIYDAAGNPCEFQSEVTLQNPSYGLQAYGTTSYGGVAYNSRVLVYDSLRRVVSSVDVVGNATYYAYDPVGNLTSITDPDNHATLFQYDAMNRPSGIRMPDTGSVYFFYDASSNRMKEVDPRGNATYYTYDSLNRPAQICDILGRSLYFGYDQVGNHSKHVDAELGTSYFAYDAINRRSSVAYTPAGADIGVSLRSSAYFVYDQMGNLTAMGDLSGLQVFGYDALNRMSRRKYGQGSTVYFFYDAVWNVTARRYPATSGVAYYSYDAVNRQTAAQAPSGATAYFTYDLSPKFTGKVLGNNVQQTIVYDADDQIQNWRYTGSGGAPLTYFDYTRDAKGLIIQAVRETSYTVYYSYDPNDRLLSEIWAKSGATPSEVYGYRYAYDLAGNRIRATINTANTYYFYDQTNQLKVTGTTSAWATPSYYIYDKNGSLTNLVEPAGATYFGYNTAGLVAQIRWSDASATYFYYDGNLQRYGMTAFGTTTYFVWDGPTLLQEQNSNGTVKEEYNNADTAIPGVGQLVEINRPGQTPQKIYPVMDPRGTVTKQLQSDGVTVQAAKEYDAFGNIIPNSATGTWIGRFTYQGQSWLEITSSDASKRLMLSPARIYDPATGRFFQNERLLGRRPSAQYLYAAQSPIGFADPLGYQEADVSSNSGGMPSCKLSGTWVQDPKFRPTGGSLKLTGFDWSWTPNFGGLGPLWFELQGVINLDGSVSGEIECDVQCHFRTCNTNVTFHRNWRQNVNANVTISKKFRDRMLTSMELARFVKFARAAYYGIRAGEVVLGGANLTLQYDQFKEYSPKYICGGLMAQMNNASIRVDLPVGPGDFVSKFIEGSTWWAK